MMRSLFAGVAGLRTHQTKMDVIGNNIANVNTTAYKSQSTTFRDLMYQTTQAASGPNMEVGTVGIGGINARQIGLGVQVGAINTNIGGQGSAQNTGNAFDIMITGDAFFVVSNGLENFFTRDGSFYVDGAGNLAMTSNGYKVMGWQVDPETGDPKPQTVSPLEVMNEDNMQYQAAATTDARVTGIVDRNDKQVLSSTGRVMNLEFYDQQGFLYTAKLSLHSTGKQGRFYVTLDDIIDNGTGKSLGADQFGLASFGSREQEMDTSIARSATAAPTLTGTIDINYVDAAGAAQTLGGALFNQDIATLPAGAVDIWQSVTATTPVPVQINQKGQLIDANGDIHNMKDGASVASTTTTGVTIGTGPGAANLVPGAYTVATDTGGNVVVSDATGAAVANMEQLIGTAYNGLNLVNEQITAFTIEQDGSLTITKKIINNVANLIYDEGTGLFDSIAGNNEGLITLGLSAMGPMFADISIDFSKTQHSNNGGSSTVSAAKGTSQGLGSGRKIGELIGISIAKSGIITASYDNGMSKCLGQIATATFANPAGLEKQGDNLYSATMNSGEFDGIGSNIEDGGGYMQSGVLEMSNVDLSQEFTEMITTQRGFQANSRIITVSDSMLEELTNLKR